MGNLVLTTAGEPPLNNNSPENRPNQDIMKIKRGTITSNKINFVDLLSEKTVRARSYLIGFDYT